MYDVLLGIGLDDEPRAIAQAEAVIDLPGDPDEVTAHLCHVFRDNPEGASVHQIGTVRRAREILEDAGVNCVHYEASGDPGEEILAAATDIDADLICVSGRKRSPAGKVVFGSTTQALVLNADRPVLAVPGPNEE
ncbi:universal stress protein [Halorubrum ezzemoulense]|jgi:nucleotide-binding universal stress UspA family protein|uniref:Universal stress protein n=2 Tax=Halorubrum ezzemoulense TaxID=337243 RepID=A0A256JA06_HALEZ|nr:MULTISPECIES: universal stress protein [Halorubrum]MDB2223505.1 universal stress protein [Halorubrum ezzemoulense]MDB2237534.1 universal stress protein [Halorubrum ezzemoulense]MDB2240867.1 universal stress protein [Halorubrum ezzemoulense]MDB2243254.1 universal stress protein [Halorubrum ezzemoulense]MDB2248972.1 universal stress protein [Halorubrum ezzemoulense]